MCLLPDAILKMQAKLLSYVLAGAIERLKGHPRSELKCLKALEALALLYTPQICIDGLCLTCFLNSKTNSKSVDLPKSTMIPVTFSTILWRNPTFQNKRAKTEKVRNPTTFDSWGHSVPVNCGRVMIS